MDKFQFEMPGMNGRILQAIMTLTQAGSWSNTKRIVLQYPELLSEEADDMLAWIKSREPVPSNQQFFQKLRDALLQARFEGIEFAFASRTGPDIPTQPEVEIPFGFEVEIQQLAELAEIAQSNASLYIQQIQLINRMLFRLQSGIYSDFQGSLFCFLGYAYANFPYGDALANLQTAIVAYHNAMKLINPDGYAAGYTIAQFLLGHACYDLGEFYFYSPLGDRSENLQQAISAYRETLRYWLPQFAPLRYARAQHDLGVSLTNLPIGDRRENLKKAIDAYHEALRFWIPQTFPMEYAMACLNLAIAFSGLPSGNQGEDLNQAIAAYLEALRFYTIEDSPLDYAKTQNNLGNAYTLLPVGDRGENFQKAIAAYQEALHGWTSQSTPQNYANTLYNLGRAFSDMPGGDRSENLHQAIAVYQEALQLTAPDSDPIVYAKIQHNLGLAYSDLLTDNQGENLQKAIAAYLEALRVYTLETAPDDFAKTQTVLGRAYFNLYVGEREENVQKAITAYQNSLRIWNQEDSPDYYAISQSELADAYIELKSGERTTNLERAITAYREALCALPSKTEPIIYANIQSKLGLAYSQLESGDQGENLKHAIAAYQEALRFHTPETYPLAYAAVQKNLGEAYFNSSIGDRGENLQKAIAAFQETLRYWDPEAVQTLTQQDLDSMGGRSLIDKALLSHGYAQTQNNLGVAYFDLPAGNRVENLYKAITALKETLRFWTPESAPLEYASSQYNLGSIYTQLPVGDRMKNLQHAVTAFHEALRFYTPETDPAQYASIQSNLGIAYASFRAGNRVENLQRSLAAFNEALRFNTLETNPLEYARIQNNLGNVYRDWPTGDRAEYLQRSIACYKEGLRIYTSKSTPREYAGIQINLGIAFIELPTGNRTENLKQAIASCLEALRYLSPEENPMEVALAHNELGIAFASLTTAGNQQKHLQRAIAHFKEALRFWTPENAPQDYARAQLNLGAACNDQLTGDMAENSQRAITHTQEALRFYTPEGAPLDYATAQYNLGVAYHNLPVGKEKENLEQAISNYQEALRFRNAETTPRDFVKTQSSLGNAHLIMRRWEEAHQAYSSAFHALITLYQITTTGIAKQAVLVEAGSIFSRDAYCLARLGRLEEAVERLEAGKTRILAEALGRDHAALIQAEPSDRANFEAARDHIKILESEVRALVAPGSTSTDAQQFLQASARLKAAHQKLASIVEHIRSYLSEFLPAGLDFPSISAVAARDCPLIYLVATPIGSLGLIVPSNLMTMPAECCVWIDDFTSDDLDRLLLHRDKGKVIGGYLVGQVEGNLSFLQSGLDNALPILGQQLVAPLVDRLVALGYRQAIVIPSGLLSLLPLPATVIEKITLTIAPSSRVLQAARQAKEGRTNLTPTLLGIGNPMPNSHPLPFARIEVESIGPNFPSESQILIYEQQATRESILEKIPGTTHLHFSCHGLFNSNEPLDSALFFSGDSRLKLRDLLDGDLDLSHSRLVVLSACQTGIIDFNRVPDEAVGFPAGFIQAGVPGVISTLWAVNDLSTALLLARFYRYHLKFGLDPATSLCRAQRWLRNSTAQQLDLVKWYQQLYIESGRRDRTAFQSMRYYRANPKVQPFSHPYYWAAFTFTGV